MRVTIESESGLVLFRSLMNLDLGIDERGPYLPILDRFTEAGPDPRFIGRGHRIIWGPLPRFRVEVIPEVAPEVDDE